MEVLLSNNLFFLVLMNKNNLLWENMKKLNKISFLMREIKTNSKMNEKNINSIMYSLFLSVMFFNLSGMVPYFFTLTSQLNVCLMLSMMFWLTIFLMSLNFNFKNFISHLVPQGSPLLLSQFMVLIELISMLIRPVTLSVRLMANLTAGHLILILCSSPFIMYSLIDLPLFLLIILEMMVAIIQAYVFMTLITMYLAEK